MALQTRTSKFGKLRNGMLVIVLPTLVGRMRHHFASVAGADIIFGRNGWIWVYLSHAAEVEVPIEKRAEIIRVSSLIRLLNLCKKIICCESIQEAWERTKDIEIENLLSRKTLDLIKEVGIIDLDMV